MIQTETRGLIAAPYSPLKLNGELNVDMIPEYKSRLANNKLTGVFISGSTGEGTSLTIEERMALTEAWTTIQDSDLKVMVHVGSNSVKESAILAAHAADNQAQAIAATGPSYFKPANEAVLVDYMAELASVAPELPFYYYHIPALNQNFLPVVRFLEIAVQKIPNLAGIKYTYEDEMEFQLCRQVANGQLDVLYGRDESLICGLVLGAKGGVGSTYNFMPGLYYEIIEAFNQGNLTLANQLQLKSMHIIQVYSKFRGLAAGKMIMKHLGIDCGPARLPNISLTTAEEKQMISELNDLSFWDYALK